MSANRWATRVRELIEARGLTQGQFAALLCVSRVTVNRWANGVQIPHAIHRWLLVGLEEERDNKVKRKEAFGS